jgi:FF domain
MKLIEESSAELLKKLDQETKESLLKEHMKSIFTQRLKDFRDLLDESGHLITPHTKWSELRKHLEDESRF